MHIQARENPKKVFQSKEYFLETLFDCKSESEHISEETYEKLKSLI